MSYNSHRRKALDESLPLPHRASHARSCTVCVCEKFRISRDSVINEVQKISGVDLNEVKSSKDIAVAMGALEKIRFEGISTDDT